MNLLKVLHALLETRSVSRAAERLHVTQPAVSHALRRLRELFSDPLLVREAGVMQLSQTARQLKEPLAGVIAQTESLLTIGRRFDPAREARCFHLAMSDAVTLEALPGIVRLLRREAPNVDLVIERGGPNNSCGLLLDDRADAALGVIPALPGSLRSRALYRDELVCVADRGNPWLRRGRLSLDGFLACPHVTMAQNSDSGIELDSILTAMGLHRRIAVTVPHYLAIPATIIGTDLVAHSRRMLLSILLLGGELVSMPVPVPFGVPELVFSLVWHPRDELDPAHIWLRGLIARAVVGARRVRGPGSGRPLTH